MLPPLLAGAVQDNATALLPATAVRPVGTCGAAAWGVAEAETEALLVPTVLVAVTVNVCATPLVRPEMVQVSAPVVVQLPAGEPVTV